MKKAQRFIPALVIALVLGGGAIFQAQVICTIPCPVWDISAILKNVAINVLKGQINEVLNGQAKLFLDMTQRLAGITDVVKFAIDMDDTPEWRIHDYFTGANHFANQFLSTLTYGGAPFDAYESVAVTRVNPSVAKWEALTLEARDALGSDSALIDLVDSTTIRAAQTTGRLRFNGRAEAEAIRILQTLMVLVDHEQSATAVAAQMSAASLVAAQSKQANIDLKAASLEQSMVSGIRARNAAARALNMEVNRLERAPVFGKALVQDADIALSVNWQP